MGRGESGDKGTGCGRAGYAVIPCSPPPELFVLIFSWIDVQYCFYFQVVHFDLRSIVWFKGGLGHPSESLPRCPLVSGAQRCTLKCRSGRKYIPPNWWVQGFWWRSSSKGGYNCKYFSVISFSCQVLEKLYSNLQSSAVGMIMCLKEFSL